MSTLDARSRDAHPIAHPIAPAFDPFGEPVAAAVAAPCASTAGDRAARRVGGAVFWSLALLILAGRVYAYDLPTVSHVAAQVSGHVVHLAQMAALR